MFHWTGHVNVKLRQGFGAAAAIQHEVYVFKRHCYHGEYAWTNYNWTTIDAYIFNTESLRWKWLRKQAITRPEENPPPKSMSFAETVPYGHTAVPIEHIVYIWGGCPPYSNVLYAFDVETHSWDKPRVSGTVPEGREHHSACVLGKVMFVHGGYKELTAGWTAGWTNDTYRLDTSTMVWSLINTGVTTPPDSSKHSATIIGTKMFVFWGYEYRQRGPTDYNYINVFDTETNCWLDTPPAQLCPGRERQLNSTFAYNGELYIIIAGGGNYLVNTFDELWKFNPETFSWTKVDLKGKGLSRTPDWKCCCRVGDRIFLFGEFRWNTWTEQNVQILDLSPSLKTLSKLAFIQYRLEQSELPHNIRWELSLVNQPF